MRFAAVAGAFAALALLCLAAAVAAMETSPYPHGMFGQPQRNSLSGTMDDAVPVRTLKHMRDFESDWMLSRYDIVPAAPSPERRYGASYDWTPFDVVINNQLVHGHVLRGYASSFSIQEPLNGCPGFARTSVTASDKGCAAATNAGFFDIYRGTCLGNVVSDGKVVSIKDSPNSVFGTTKSGNLVFGYLTAAQLNALDLQNLVSGVTWLVRNGTVYLDESIAAERPDFNFVWIKAPRVAVGSDADGRVMVMEVDGNEPLNQGLDLYEFAELARSKGFVNAINIDGGGSAAVWIRGKNVVSKPSDNCNTSTAKCERMVTTITCFK